MASRTGILQAALSGDALGALSRGGPILLDQNLDGLDDGPNEGAQITPPAIQAFQRLSSCSATGMRLGWRWPKNESLDWVTPTW
jgi:hypothetical protein